MSFAEAAESPFDPFVPVPLDNGEELTRLERSIRYAGEFALLFAVCNQNELRGRLIEDLKARLVGKKVEELAIREPVRNLYHMLDSKYFERPETKPDVLMVYGVEAWLPAGDPGAYSDFVLNLNAARNHFAKLLAGPMVLWVPEHALDSIARGAPDFFSVRSGIFTFAGSADEGQRMEMHVRELGYEEIAGLSYDEKKTRIAEIEKLLEEYRSLPEERRDEKAEERLLIAAAKTYRVMGMNHQAEPILTKLLSRAETRFGTDSPEYSIALNNLAQLLHDTNRLSEAEPLMRRALVIDEAAFSPDHPIIAIRLNNLAQLLHDTNRLSEAEPLMRRALAIAEAAFSPNYPNVATHLNNLAQLLQDTNRLDEAEPYYRRALSLNEAAFGPDHPNVATNLNNLALLLQATGRMGEAEPLYRRALAIDEAAFGPDHSVVASDLNNLARLLQATNRLGEAEPLLRRALGIMEKSLGPEHPHTRIIQKNYDSLMKDMQG